MAKKVTKTRVTLLEEALLELIRELSLTDVDDATGNVITMTIPDNASEEQLETKIIEIITAIDEDDGLPIIRPDDKFSIATQSIIDELNESLKAPEKEVDLAPYDIEDIIEDIEVAEELPELVAIANKYEELSDMVGYIGSYKKFEVLKEAMLRELKKGTEPEPDAKKVEPVKEKPVKTPVSETKKETKGKV
ncbi:MAG: hypothetical protein WC554_01765, partial [Clostridia bacterium]